MTKNGVAQNVNCLVRYTDIDTYEGIRFHTKDSNVFQGLAFIRNPRLSEADLYKEDFTPTSTYQKVCLVDGEPYSYDTTGELLDSTKPGANGLFALYSGSQWKQTFTFLQSDGSLPFGDQGSPSDKRFVSPSATVTESITANPDSYASATSADLLMGKEFSYWLDIKVDPLSTYGISTYADHISHKPYLALKAVTTLPKWVDENYLVA